MYQKVLCALLLVLAFACGDDPDITRNQNPFPYASSTQGTLERLAADVWSWEPIPMDRVNVASEQDRANDIFAGVEIDFTSDGEPNSSSGRFTYKNGDGRIFLGAWRFDLVDNILELDFDQKWDTPIITQGTTAVFDVHEITSTVLEMRFTEVLELKSAILVFIHKG